MLNEFLEGVRRKETLVGVIGLGYVGLPLAMRFAECGFEVAGFDIDPGKIEVLRARGSYIKTVSPDRVAAVMDHRPFRPTTAFSLLRDCDAIIMCVPTPLGKNREPDMSYVEETTRQVQTRLRYGQLIVLESTTYPGTTDELVRELLDSNRSGLRAGRDYWLAYSPEREDPGNVRFDTQTIPKLVGGLTPNCLSVAVALYGSVLDKVIPVGSMRVAEMAKLYENVFRGVNIALVNELKMVCDAMGIDVWEVIDAAATKPFGFMRFTPGPGLGGHCIPIDPFYLTWKAREYDITTRFIELAGEVNTAMPHYVVHRLTQALNAQQRAVNGSRIMLLGVAYKPNVDDVRESPAFKIIDLLQHMGAEVCYHDPYVPHIVPTRHYALDMKSQPLELLERLTWDYSKRAIDAAIIVTDHDGIDYKYVVEQAPLVIDTRNATRAMWPRPNIVKA